MPGPQTGLGSLSTLFHQRYPGKEGGGEGGREGGGGRERGREGGGGRG